ncbi:arylamine N-acetyltransferase family protein [Paenibacillus puerhi]|uniref:arylamine N-acetyltransferase family protein n=1 Tax=Paenibacillus puerhi TaxID=2692622 RepID=UPI00135B8C18|nr:arylamine N-acetyltransferase [Paenibacillus puerhi]
MYIMTKEELQAYLARIGLTDVQAPSKSYLFALHKAHVERFSWQTIDIFARKPAPIGFPESVQLLGSGRSGYCFHLNGAFGSLLHSLGFDVRLHRAGVQPLGAEPRVNSFHLGLTVHLKNDQQEEEIWIADVGLGDMPFEPLPLLVGTYEQAPYTYKVASSGVAAGGWRLEHDPLASFIGVDIAPEPLSTLDEFIPKHEYYSRSPESPWYDMFLVRQRHATGSHELRGCIWSSRGLDGLVKTELLTQSQWLEVLADYLGEKLVAYSPHERAELWNRVQAAHETWKRSRSE